ncbi:MAG TPA: polymer-forming cytoskeletal protein, partial [Candidatus Binatia bacterium]|nr:polymer-forming cytoskeletal protein [Candidatus Binatia bacterium]
MAWFDRGSGEKKNSEVDPAKTSVVAVKPDPIKTTESVTPTPAAPAAAPAIDAPPVPAEAELIGHLYRGSRVSGQLLFQGPARIDGSVEGEFQCLGTLTIGEGA